MGNGELASLAYGSLKEYMKFKEYIILYMYRIAFSWIVATPSQLNCPAVATQLPSHCPANCPAVATLSQLCRNFAQLNCPAIAQLSQNHLYLPLLQRAKSPARGDVFGPNRSHSHSLIRGLHGEDLNSGGHGLTTLVRFYVARCSQGVGS